MISMPNQIPSVASLIGQLVVLDLSSPFVYIGLLAEDQGEYLVLDMADAHDLRDSATTRERYILNCREHGVRANRSRTWVNRREIVALSRLEDVLLD
jgi:hypothetical protein